MAYILEQSVINEIEKAFPEEKWELIKKMLSETKLWLEESGPPPRIHVAIIWLSKGNIDKFKNELLCAADDWRDTLINAGLANENWEEILNNKGISSKGWQ